MVDYVSYSAAGEGSTIYIIDTGLNPLHTEFSLGVVKRWIFANGVAKTEADDDSSSHGTCTAYKIAGRVFGVAKNASLIVVKRSLKLSSWLDAMAKVANDLRRRARAGELIADYNFINIHKLTSNGQRFPHQDEVPDPQVPRNIWSHFRLYARK